MQSAPQPHPEPEHKPKIWMGTKALKDQATQPDPILKEDYCDVFTPCRRDMPPYMAKTFPPIWTGRNWKKMTKRASGVRSAAPPKSNPVPIPENNTDPKAEEQMPQLEEEEEEEEKNREKSMEGVE